ncbi:Glycosyl hydrolases family 2, sugar binding domain [Chitinophaga jiangningensis]|uniref:Glycosyl hydrolases family 2, sugar binding domain n=1 Tax=Chitinophaga jiangningensis TaxID=1419482 RepID=A0A1M7AE59_9BACT|nr:glycosyl hydrolase [Chitinophaga jiangningensis]SHL40970.1 Glycosyl hydrolases family 2, sugar binding domain [Chitinophaga jiangningensis]
MRGLKIILILLVIAVPAYSQQPFLQQAFRQPAASAKPWVLWYWMHAAVSKAGIRADLEAMQQAGIGGAYLVAIKDTTTAVSFSPAARQLSPEWWEMVRYAMHEAKRLGLELGMHLSDGFSTAGGPWITPEESMQQLVWTKNYISAGNSAPITLAQPITREGYYKDIAVYAYPLAAPLEQLQPVVTTSTGAAADFLATPGNKQSFKSEADCWIQYTYPAPYTVKSVHIETGTNNYPAQRLTLQCSNNGKEFRTVMHFVAARHGWKDNVQGYTYSITPTTARYFRLVYEKDGAAAGAEDLDAAKWKPTLKVTGIYLNNESAINGFEGKNGSIWRATPLTTASQAPDAIPLQQIITLTDKLQPDGRLNWRPPPGNWVIVRMGHTSTGEVNYTGGAGKGLECDKFSAAAINKQFDHWFAEAFPKTDPALAKEVLKTLYIDSWECGSQNWSAQFPQEFRKRRGYSLMPYLPVMAGIPVESAAVSEKVLHDVRQTIADLISEVFFKTLATRAHAIGCRFSTESVAPVMMGDGMLHYQYADIPMGEFWFNSPTHDKPNDMLDAISGAHVYGKNIVQAEAFTTLRMDWSEHPGGLKITGDRNLALGVNRMVMHVFSHNPWTNRRPGMTLDGVGLYYQRDQTWFKQSKAWISYITRCQSLLQQGRRVTDIAVFTGDQLPRRALTQDRFVHTLPGLFGQQRLQTEQARLENKGLPMRTMPEGVTHSANMADPDKWVDALRGYSYDSFNPDALLKMSVKNGRVVLPGGASYAVLVIPDTHPLMPDAGQWSLPVAKKLLQLINEGTKVILHPNTPVHGIGFKDDDVALQKIFTAIQAKAIPAPFNNTSLLELGIPKDLEVLTGQGAIAWCHRSTAKAEIYFIANQQAYTQQPAIRLRGKGMPEIWDPVTGETSTLAAGNNNTFQLTLAPAQSVFIILYKDGQCRGDQLPVLTPAPTRVALKAPWQLAFDEANGGPATPVQMDTLRSWTQLPDSAAAYYSGTVVYRTTFNVPATGQKKQYHLQLDSIFNIATVTINGTDCGTLWTPPFRLDVTKAIIAGNNTLEIAVTNTWHNRLIWDHYLPADKRVTNTTAPYRFKDETLLPAGIVGNVALLIQ